jgi:hypothetical protein
MLPGLLSQLIQEEGCLLYIFVIGAAEQDSSRPGVGDHGPAFSPRNVRSEEKYYLVAKVPISAFWTPTYRVDDLLLIGQLCEHHDWH